jgi:hypothetical protein
MGNNQSQSPSPIQKLPRKIASKFPVPSALRDRQKDSGYHSGSASSSGTVTAKGARAKDQTGTTVASAGSEQGVTPRSESAPDAIVKAVDAPAPPTRSAESVGLQ